ncbi:MAG: DUF3256 family protein [Bacteroidales bacterium]|nr:DUF3256 family protein [Bacteroidales bacterium]
MITIRKNSLLLLIFINTHLLFTQNIADLFIQLPEGMFVLNSSKRRDLVEAYKSKSAGINDEYGMIYKIEILDFTNGYLSIIDPNEGYWEMCYWNKPDGIKLVALGGTGCGPVCSTSLKFIRYSNKYLETLDLYEVMQKIELSDLFNIDEIKNKNYDFDLINSYFNDLPIIYVLPRFGKSIIAEIQLDDLMGDPVFDQYLPFLIGKKVEYLWQDGSFVISKVFD